MKILFFITLAIIFIGNKALSVSQPKAMNGISFEEYQGFQKKWKFVTVRYREDSREMRFVYANDVAWDALLEGSQDFPDGSVFGKISILTQIDDSFPSSLVPSGARRVQFMVRDKKKYAETQGWGYGLFDALGVPHKGDHNAKAKACAACHNLVPERGQVFSKRLGLIDVNGGSFGERISENWKKKLNFVSIKRSELSSDLQKLIPMKYIMIRVLEGPLRRELFYGTLDEIRPLLFLEASSSSLPAILASKDWKKYSLVYPELSMTCSEKGLKSYMSVHTLPNKRLFSKSYCRSQ